MVFVAGVAEVVHPEEVVVGGVVDAVVAVESQAEDGHADEVQEYGVIAAAADAGVGESVVDDAGELNWLDCLPSRSLALDGRLPRVVESSFRTDPATCGVASTSMGASEATACP